jgi:DNA repair exonuclease SbcCD nuclease subunit
MTPTIRGNIGIMRYLITSDWHTDSHTAGHPREAEIDDTIKIIEAACIANRVDVVVNLGDYFDPCTPQDLYWASRLIRHARRLHESALRGSIWIAGNHDTVADSRGQTGLSPLAEVADVFPGMHVCEDPTWIPEFNFLAIPHPRGTKTSFQDALSRALSAAKSGCVVGAHLTVPGALTGSESTDMARGRDETIPAGGIQGLQPAAVFNGHYHRGQVIGVNGMEVHIPGSIVRHTFAEAGNESAYLLVDV